MHFNNWIRTVLANTINSSRRAGICQTRGRLEEVRHIVPRTRGLFRCLLHICRIPLFAVLRGFHGRTLEIGVDVERQIHVNQCDERGPLWITGA